MAVASSSRLSGLSLFDQQLRELLKAVRVVGKDVGNRETESDEEKLSIRERGHGNAFLDAVDKSGMSCSVCQIFVFDSVEVQREHFKLDWHRFNLKQKLMDKPILSEDAFEETISGEVSSISGSDSDTDSDGDLSMESTQLVKPPINDIQPEEKEEAKSSSTGRQHPKVFFVNEDGDVLSVYRSVLYSVKKIPATPDAMVSLFTSLPKQSYWIVLMTAGGHFAGAVFKGRDVLTHKTFHRYTVRAKRGTAQGARDAQQGGKQPKSAGASLRRHNEAALLQEVQDLIKAWSQHVEQCDQIFIRTPAYNKSMFFGGKKPPFKKDDERIRTIPFPTRRPTFNEVKRVHQELSHVHLLGKDSDAELQGLFMQLTQRKLGEDLPTVGEDKVRLWQEGQNTDNNTEGKEKIDSQQNSVCNEKDDSDEPCIASAAKPQEASKKTKKKKAKNKRVAESELENGEKVFPEQHLWNRLYCAVVSGNKAVISSVLGVSVKITGRDDLQCEGICLVQEGNQDLNTKNSGITEIEKNVSIENGEDVSRTSAECDHNLECISSLSSERDYNLNQDAKDSVTTNRTEPVINTECKNLQVSEFRGSNNGCQADSKTSGTGNSSDQNKTRSEETDQTREGGRNRDMTPRSVLDVINGRFGEGGETLLHVASRFSRMEFVLTLLGCGADPAVKDSKGRPPFLVAGSKETRNAFRRFMACFPDRFDYIKAQIPSALTPEMESEKEKRNTERKKAQKKAQKQRVKEQKALERKKEEEEKETKTLQAMSDREKRALAAEKRFAQQQAVKQAGITSCCAWCSASLTGQVPFERLTYKYCSTACVKDHRLDMESQKQR